MKRLVRIAGLLLLLLSVVHAHGSAQQGGLTHEMFYHKSWAVVIGINHYQDSSLNLEYAVNDAQSIATRFQQMGFEVIALMNQDATRERILDLLTRDLPEKIGRNDSLVIFYAGHGATGRLPNGNEVGFIVPYDARRNFDIVNETIRIGDYQEFTQRTNFVSLEDIRNISETVQAKHLFYILDGCYSGFLDPAVYNFRSPLRTEGAEQQSGGSGSSRGLAPVVAPIAKQTQQAKIDIKGLEEEIRLTSRNTVQVLTAGSSGETVSEKAGHGIFTYYLLRALDGVADYNKNCVIRASELATYLKEIVPPASEYSQTPLFNRVSGEGEVIFIPPICNPLDEADLQPPIPDTSWKKTEAYKGPKSEKYKQPVQVAVDRQENLYVLDAKRETIYKFDAQGSFVSDELRPAEVGEDWKPFSMAVKANGDLWVFYSNTEEERPGFIIVYQPDGTPGENWAGDVPIDACSFGEHPFPSKALITLDIEDNLILVDQEHGRMMKCDRNGEMTAQWGAQEELTKYKNVIDPEGIAVDMFGYVYVANTGGHGIQKFFNGEWIKTRWPQLKGDKPYYFDSPHGIIVDNKLHVYVADTKNHRIKKYTSGGEKLMTILGKKKAKKGKKDGEFNEPRGLALNQNHTVLYVADTKNERIQRFTLPQ